MSAMQWVQYRALREAHGQFFSVGELFQHSLKVTANEYNARGLERHTSMTAVLVKSVAVVVDNIAVSNVTGRNPILALSSHGSWIQGARENCSVSGKSIKPIWPKWIQPIHPFHFVLWWCRSNRSDLHLCTWHSWITAHGWGLQDGFLSRELRLRMAALSCTVKWSSLWVMLPE